MPKKDATPSLLHQHLLRSSPFADYQNSATLVQSARRRLQYSQLPVRCTSKRSSNQGRLVNSLKRFPVLGTPKRSISAKNCCPEDAPGTARFLAAAGSPAARKSLSMVDLSPAANNGVNEFESNELRLDSGSTSARGLDDASERRTEETLSLESCNWSVRFRDEREIRESRAASLVCRALAVNAWRRRRDEVAVLRVTVDDLGQQLDQLQLQIVVLRRLLDNENARVASLAGELHKAKAQIDDLTKERDQLKIDKETAEEEAQKQLEISEERSVTAENLRNELRSAQDRLDALDKQISKDREKLLKLREDKKMLIEKVTVAEALAMERKTRAEKAELALDDAQIRLDTQTALADSLQEEVQRFLNILKDKENEKIELENLLRKIEEENVKAEDRLQTSEKNERALNFRALDLESQLVEKESKIKRVEAAYAAQMSELNELRERFIRQSQENCWSSKVLQLAGSVVRAPRVILRTLSFFSSGMPLIL